MSTLEAIAHQVIVSCQAGEDEPLHGSIYMAGMARAAKAGGAGGLRVNGVADICAVRQAVDLPIIGIEKQKHPEYGVLITPDFAAAQRIAEAGADMIALDGTIHRAGKAADLRGLIARIHDELHLPVMADVSCLDDAVFAQNAGADILGTTLAGYTEHGRVAVPGPDLDFLRELVAKTNQPVIAEGRFEQPHQVAQAFAEGAYAVVVGGAVTRPQQIAERFVAASQPRTGAQHFFDAVTTILDQVTASEHDAIQRAASAVTESITAGGMLFLFGTGHSHLLAEEGHYRAGGLAPVCPILISGLMLHESSMASSLLERTPGVVAAALERYELRAGDSLIVFSNSGVNAAPVEIAKIARQKGLTLIAVQSSAYAAQTPAGALGRKLQDYADVVIDNHLPAGDSLVSIGSTALKTGAGSTVVGAFILNAVLTEVVERLAANGETPPIFISANMPGAQEHNAPLFARYQGRNPHL